MGNSPNSNLWHSFAANATAGIMLAPTVISGAPSPEQNLEQQSVVATPGELLEFSQECIYPSYERSSYLKNQCGIPAIEEEVIVVDFGESNDKFVEDIFNEAEKVIPEVTSGVVDIDFEIVEASDSAKDAYKEITSEAKCINVAASDRVAYLALENMPELAGKNVVATSPLRDCDSRVNGLAHYEEGWADVYNVDFERAIGRYDDYIRWLSRVAVHEVGHSVLTLGHSGTIEDVMTTASIPEVFDFDLDAHLSNTRNYLEYGGHGPMAGTSTNIGRQLQPLGPEFFNCLPQMQAIHENDNPLAHHVIYKPKSLSYEEIARGEHFLVRLDDLELESDYGHDLSFYKLSIIPIYEPGRINVRLALSGGYSHVTEQCHSVEVASFYMSAGDAKNQINLTIEGDGYTLIKENSHLTLSLLGS